MGGMKRTWQALVLCGTIATATACGGGGGGAGATGAGGAITDSGSDAGGTAGSAGSAGVGGAGGSGGATVTRYWHRVVPPSGKSYEAIRGSAPDNVWAVGSSGLVSRFNGSKWIDASIGQDRPIVSVATTSPSNVWIAADYAGDVFEWNGSSFTLDNYNFAVTSVYKLWARTPSDVWLGTQWNFGAGPSYHFDGTNWANVPVPDPTQDSIEAFWGASSDDVWAASGVGELYHYDQSGWTLKASNAGVHALWGSARNDIWAVGTRLSHFDGSSWTPTSFQPPGAWDAVWGTASDQVWAAGADVWRFDGTTWSKLSDPGLPAGASDLWAGSPTQLYLISGGDIYYSTSTDCAASEKCSSLCVDKSSDPDDCGSCGTSCGPGTCRGGTCTCDAPQTFCAGDCVDTQSDAQNCGGCGKACPSGGQCTAGQCRCPSGTILCGNACVDPNVDSNNCGGCGQQCASDRACNSGSCQCVSGKTDCGGTCVSLDSDAQHCGSCGNTCSVACNGGKCITVSQIAAGALSTCAAMSDGSVRCWGRLSGGALQKTPLDDGLSGVDSIDAGGSGQYQQIQTLCAVSGGSIDCADYLLSATTAVPSLSDAVAVDVGFEDKDDFRCALRAGSSVGCWGDNNEGLGDATTFSSSTPITPTALPAAQQVSVGDYGACARASGQVWCWGYDDGSGMLTTPKAFGNINDAVDIATGENYVYIVRSDGTIWHATDFDAAQVSGVSNAVKVAAGYNYRECALLSGGTVSCWDYATQPASVPGLANAKQISVGNYHACAVTQAGVAYCWGKNSDAQLGTGDTTDSATAVAPTW
jgi:Regulator of chromosome condensation (RCC1) repeat